ncbi:sulfotransferase family protein [Salinibacter sp.]|uniref:sulfotransferase family protein n=1 Tax=Salinibacter sp. TaxID=2065818 RepID=UPI0021E8D9C6|nr:sulfotransferase [Salinibacter sp.]
MDFDGSGLVFIACQPRSGSTMLQRMLGAHSEIYTISEPWVMLHPLYALRENGIQTKYDAGLARTALESMFEELPNGRQDYIDGLRQMYGGLYEKLLRSTDKTLFLDKTPRYYHILGELQEVFPQARFLLLVRHPLSVLSSILRTWVHENWLHLSNFREDLLVAPDRIVKAQQNLSAKGLLVRYENLVQDPQSGLSTICEHLQVSFEPTMIEYGEKEGVKWTFGDPRSVYKHNRPKKVSMEKWTEPESAQEWRLLWEYAHKLGSETFGALGYQFEESIQKLDAVRPSNRDLRYTVSLKWLLKDKTELERRLSRRGVDIINTMRNDGIQSVILQVMKFLASRLRAS